MVGSSTWGFDITTADAAEMQHVMEHLAHAVKVGVRT